MLAGLIHCERARCHHNAEYLGDSPTLNEIHRESAYESTHE
jgi:hypothetical protein